MASRAYKVWRDRIDSGTMTKTQCQQYARVVVSLVETGYTRTRTNLTEREAEMVHEEMRAAHGVTLTDEHEAQGLRWLEKYAATRLPQLPSDWRDRFSHFLYMGEAVDVGRGYWSTYIPVWSIILFGKDGGPAERWDYAATAWQAPEQMDHAWKVAS